MWTWTFWKAALERSVKTFAQTEAALLLADGTGLIDAPWEASLSVAGMAAVVSLLTSVASYGATGTASATRAEIPAGDVLGVDTGSGPVAGPALGPAAAGREIHAIELTTGEGETVTYSGRHERPA